MVKTASLGPIQMRMFWISSLSKHIMVCISEVHAQCGYMLCNSLRKPWITLHTRKQCSLLEAANRIVESTTQYDMSIKIQSINNFQLDSQNGGTQPKEWTGKMFRINGSHGSQLLLEICQMLSIIGTSAIRFPSKFVTIVWKSHESPRPLDYPLETTRNVALFFTVVIFLK